VRAWHVYHCCIIVNVVRSVRRRDGTAERECHRMRAVRRRHVLKLAYVGVRLMPSRTVIAISWRRGVRCVRKRDLPKRHRAKRVPRLLVPEHVCKRRCVPFVRTWILLRDRVHPMPAGYVQLKRDSRLSRVVCDMRIEYISNAVHGGVVVRRLRV
jgi:hypothetical protein